MKYIKLYEDFRYEEEVLEPQTETETELSDKSIDDVLKPDFFEEDEQQNVFQDERGVYHISDWKVY